MLSKGEKLTERKRLRELPPLERPITVRLKFRKIGTLQYISHLDLQRTFNRVIVRACIPVWYTKGFNPHAKLVFSTPLSVGAQSEYEFLDIRIDREMECSEIMERLNQELTEELQITEAYVPTTDFSEIAWASYTITVCGESVGEDTKEQVEATLSQSPLLMTKRTKAGEKEIDILPLIHSYTVEVDASEKQMSLSVVLNASVGEYLNPELLISALKMKTGLLGGNPMQEWYTIMRTAVMKKDFSLFR